MDVLGSNGFRLTGVEFASTRWARFRGLMLRSPAPLLLPTSLVHGFWLHGPLWVVGISDDGTVTGVVCLERRRLVWLRGAHWALELPPGSDLPVPGERLALRPSPGEAEADAGPPLRLRHAHRQPGRRFAPPGRDAGDRRSRVRRGHQA